MPQAVLLRWLLKPVGLPDNHPTTGHDHARERVQSLCVTSPNTELAPMQEARVKMRGSSGLKSEPFI